MEQEHVSTLDRELSKDPLVEEKTKTVENADVESGGGNQAALQEKTKKRDPTLANDEGKFFDIANKITGIMEAASTKGDYSALTVMNDGGGVSYGKHQATLTSGTLGKILHAYVKSSEGDNVSIIKSYLPQVDSKDMALKRATKFLKALKSAGNESEMQIAQDMIFSKNYWEPAKKMAKKKGITTPLGLALLYDTKIQGGMESVMARAKAALGGNIGDKVGGKVITEQKFLKVYAEQRRDRLKGLARAARRDGKKKRAQALDGSVYRCVGFLELINAGNLNVAGPSGDIKMTGPGMAKYSFKGFDSGEVSQGKQGAEGIDNSKPMEVIGEGTVSVGELNVRRGPDGGYTSVGTVKDGQKLELVEDIKDGWVRINFGEGTAYVSAKYVNVGKDAAKDAEAGEVIDHGIVSIAALDVRQGIGAEHDVIGRVTKGQSLEVLAKENGWLQINFEGRTGFISGAYVELDKETEDKVDPIEYMGIAVIVPSALNVHLTPSKENNNIGTVMQGEKLNVTGQQGVWMEIEYNGGRGFIHEGYVNYSPA